MNHNKYCSRYKPVGLHTQREQLGVSCQVAGCEACIPSHTAGSLTSLESQKSQVGCNLQGNLEDVESLVKHMLKMTEAAGKI